MYQYISLVQIAVLLLLIGYGFLMGGTTTINQIKSVKNFKHAGDTYPTCIDIINITPPPNSFINQSSHPFFIVTFSRAVKKIKGSKEECFLTPSLIEFHKILPIKTNFVDSSRRRIMYTFYLGPDQQRIYKTLYFIIDGGHYMPYSNPWPSFVPLSVFGPYHTYSHMIKSTKQSKVLFPSPYCKVHLRRPLPEPFINSSSTSEITAQVLPEGHEVISTSLKNYELKLSAEVIGTGDNYSLIIPKVVKVKFDDVNVSIAIPGGLTVNFSKADLWYKIPVKSQIIHEIRERVYHIGTPKGFKNIPYIPDVSSIGDLFQTKQIFNQYSLHSDYTKSVVLSYFVHESAPFIISKDAPTNSIDPREKLRGIRGYEDYIPTPLLSQVCPHNSTRTRNTGRWEPVFHDLEYGPFYRLISADFDKFSEWTIQSTTRVFVNSKDVTQNVSFGGLNSPKTRVPSFLLEALKKYVMLINARSEIKGENYLSLDEGINIPRSKLHKKCNGIMQFLNLQQKKIPNFCNKRFGNCIDSPFSSTNQYPVLPPFNVHEFAGWTDNPSKMPSFLFNRIVSEIGGIYLSGRLAPRAAYHYKDNKRFIYLSAPDTSADIVTQISIQGITLLKPNFMLFQSSCKTIWQLTKKVQDKAVLYVILENTGKGGADVTAKVNCSSLLNIYPNSRQKTAWISPGTSMLMKFTIDGSNSVEYDEMSHYCQMDVIVHLPPEFLPQQLVCFKKITTHYGLFADPCFETSTLPEVSLKYFHLPVSQRDPDSNTAVRRLIYINTSAVLMEVVSISLKIAYHEQNLISNLNQLKIHCRNPMVYFEEEESVIFKSAMLSAGATASHEWNHIPIVYQSSFLSIRKIYFFAQKNFVGFSGCSIELWANRPHRACHSNPTLVTAIHVPLIESDIYEIENQKRGKFYILEYVYGSQSDGIMITLIVCLFIVILGSSVTIFGYLTMFLLHKRLPNLRKIILLRRNFTQAQRKEKKHWEDPQMYLQSDTTDANKSYYVLYDFKCTDSLNVIKLKTLKVAGLLRYGDKELQIVFGHVKNVYICNETYEVWLQASSGWYLLKSENVLDEYRDNFISFKNNHKLY